MRIHVFRRAGPLAVIITIVLSLMAAPEYVDTHTANPPLLVV